MDLWTWAQAAYARPGVEALCLELQDDHGQNIPLLLWAAWGGLGDPAALARAAVLAREWEVVGTGPLRAARRGLKPARPPIPDAAREALRDQVKALELASERLLFRLLEQAATVRGSELAPEKALAAAAVAWGGSAPADRLAALVAALG